ncbi:MAG TPA: response regulator transcription factor [Gaiellales bacterium]
MRVYIIDPHPIYRRGLAACLAALEEIQEVWQADGPGAAELDPNLAAADVVVLDGDVEGGCELVRRLRPVGRPRVLICAGSFDEPGLLDSVQAGACGYLTKDTLTPETLAAGVRAVHSGAGVLPPDVLGTLLRTLATVSRDVLEPRGLSLTALTTRERNVLRLVADGLPTREVAERLSYSERTIKAVMHDVTTKLHAKTRSQAVAQAVREGLI